MKISLDEVNRIARLAHLRFSQAESERLRGQLDQILAYIERLDRLPTGGLEPAAGGAMGRSGAAVPASPGDSMRPDAPMPTLPVDEALANAPESGRGHFKVPRVIG